MRWNHIFAGLVGAWLCGAAAAQDLPLEWNLRAQVRDLFSKLESGQRGSLAILGDSISFKLNSCNWYMRDRFWADYGNSGDGYLATGPGFNGAGPEQNGPRDGIGVYFSLTGTVRDDAGGPRSPWGYTSPDGIYTRIFDAGSMRLHVFGPLVRLHYLKQPGGGVMRLTLNGKALLDAPTDGPLEHAALDLDLGGGPGKVKKLLITSPGGGVVQATGLDMRTGLGGFVYHRLARGGAGPRDFNLSNTPQTGEILADLAPDLLIVMLDCGWVELETYVADMNALLDFYTAQMPDTPVVLMSHHPFKTTLIHEQAVMLYQIAQERGMGFINLYDTFPGGFEEMNALGFMLDVVHFTHAGGQWFGSYIYERLKHAGTCLPPTIDSPPQDLTVVEGFPAAFTAASADADAFQWRKDGAVIAGAMQDTLVIDAAAPGDAGSYDCLLTNACDITTSPAAVLTVLPDGDHDGFAPDEDCDDADASVHPGADELLDGIDNNCDGQIDEEREFYRDADGDGFGDPGDWLLAVERPDGYAKAAGDCDDADPAINPDAQEVLDDLDNNCDGQVDEGFEQTFYRDGDGDGYGDPGDTLFVVHQPDGYTLAAGDCDDADALVNPAAAEVCDGIDNNCDGQTDENSGPLITEDPQSQTVDQGQTAAFSVADVGGATYQWRFNGWDLLGAHGATYQIQNAHPLHSGTYSVLVSNPCGSATSADATLTVVPVPPPAAPSGLVGSESPKGAANLFWTDNAGDETGFQVWRERRVGNAWKEGAVVAAPPADAVSYAQSPGVGLWRYRVRAVKGNLFSGWTTYVSIFPAKPTGLIVQPVNGSASLAWTDASDFEASFAVQRQKFAGTWGSLVNLPGQGMDAQSMTDSPGPGKYRYRIRASNAAGHSAWTVWATVTLP